MIELCLKVDIYDDFLFQIYLLRLACMSRICVHKQSRLVIACAACFLSTHMTSLIFVYRGFSKIQAGLKLQTIIKHDRN